MSRVGPAGWSYPEWEGIVYPRKKPAGFHPLGALARSFACVELNSSFYAEPRAEHAERWLAEAAAQPSFRFTAQSFHVARRSRLVLRTAAAAGATAAAGAGAAAGGIDGSSGSGSGAENTAAAAER